MVKTTQAARQVMRGAKSFGARSRGNTNASQGCEDFPSETCWMCGGWRSVKQQNSLTHTHSQIHTPPSATSLTSLLVTLALQFLFEWTPVMSGPSATEVYLLTNFDGWKKTPMVKRASGVFDVSRMVPRGLFYFMFECDGVLRCVTSVCLCACL